MNTREVNCQTCSSPLPAGFYNTDRFFTCPNCERVVRVDAFPALFRQQGPATPGENVVLDTEASCFYHPRKKAAVHCFSCGRFLCALCDMDINGKHFCPQCLESGSKTLPVKNLENRTVRYDMIAMALAIYPLLIFWLTIITAPIALYTAVRHWKSPLGVLPRTKIRFVVAILIAGLEMTGWVLLIAYMIRSI